jgi:uncharacterized membrane protein SirB2
MSLLEFAKAIDATSLSTALKTVSWIVPLVQCIHILMVGVVFISILMISLRVLGCVRNDEPLTRIWSRFAPFLWNGIVVMVITGVLLVITEPVREFMALSFRLKMLLLAIGVVSAAAFGRRVRAEVAAAGAEPPVSAGIRMASFVTLVLWIAIIILGRTIAYDDSVWGSWSPAVLQRGGVL